MATQNPTVMLRNGVKVPMLGLGKIHVTLNYFQLNFNFGFQAQLIRVDIIMTL